MSCLKQIENSLLQEQSAKDLSSCKKFLLNVLNVQNVVTEKLTEILKPYEISGEQYAVLKTLRNLKGNPANMCFLQEQMVSKKSNTTRLVDKLLLKEFVTRNVCSQNRRKIEILITQKGLELLKELDTKILEYEYFFAKKLNSEELNQLNVLLEKCLNK